MAFTRATKSQAKLRLAVFGPSGAGKTFTSLRVAAGLGKNIAVIDTERGSASKYADRFAFDVAQLDARKDIDTICQNLRDATGGGYDVIIIDSLSHAWEELLDEVNKIAKAKYRGNTWSAWSDGTPKQRQLVDAILSFPGHVIATMRSKTEWTTEKDDKTGKNTPVRVGLAPQQGKGIEYEFDLLMELSVDHVANILKDRTGKYQDVLIEKPGEEFGQELAEWLADGVPVAEFPPEPPAGMLDEPEKLKPGLSTEKAAGLHRKLGGMGLTQEEQSVLASAIAKREVTSFTELNTREATDVYEAGRSLADDSASLLDYGVDAKTVERLRDEKKAKDEVAA